MKIPIEWKSVPQHLKILFLKTTCDEDETCTTTQIVIVRSVTLLLYASSSTIPSSI